MAIRPLALAISLTMFLAVVVFVAAALLSYRYRPQYESIRWRLVLVFGTCMAPLVLGILASLWIRLFDRGKSRRS